MAGSPGDYSKTLFSAAFDPIALQASAPATYGPDPRFKLADQWMLRREMRLEINYSFQELFVVKIAQAPESAVKRLSVPLSASQCESV